jgi:hypothetical protein
MLEIQNAHTLQVVQNITTNTPTFNIRGLEPATDFILTVFAFNNKGKSEPLRIDSYTLRTEQQLAATTTQLESKNPMRFVPILGMLVGIVLVLVLLAMAVVAVIKSKSRQNRRLGKTERSMSQSMETESCHQSPDVIPHQKVVGLMYSTSSYEDLTLKRIEVTSKDNKERSLPTQNSFSTASKDNRGAQAVDCQYAELSFQPTSESQQLIPKKTEPTIYAQIDYSEMGQQEKHRQKSHITDIQDKHRQTSHITDKHQQITADSPVTSMLAPYYPPQQPMSQSRSATLKRVQFLDETPGHKSDKYATGSLPRNSGRKSGHLCPLHAGTLPRNYSTSQQQIKQGDIHQIQSSVVNCSSLSNDGDLTQLPPCSPVKDVESNL